MDISGAMFKCIIMDLRGGVVYRRVRVKGELDKKAVSYTHLAAGGHWHRGSYCGPRAINPDDQPWNVNVHIGTRLACDAL